MISTLALLYSLISVIIAGAEHISRQNKCGYKHNHYNDIILTNQTKAKILTSSASVIIKVRKIAKSLLCITYSS
jgi:hypothetical protein